MRKIEIANFDKKNQLKLLQVEFKVYLIKKLNI